MQPKQLKKPKHFPDKVWKLRLGEEKPESISCLQGGQRERGRKRDVKRESRGPFMFPTLTEIKNVNHSTTVCSVLFHRPQKNRLGSSTSPEKLQSEIKSCVMFGRRMQWWEKEQKPSNTRLWWSSQTRGGGLGVQTFSRGLYPDKKDTALNTNVFVGRAQIKTSALCLILSCPSLTNAKSLWTWTGG